MWIESSVFYQIYPIGFCGAPHENNGYTSSGILKVAKWTDHFNFLNVDCVLFNPIFESDTHGYDTVDYTKIDKRLGTNEDFASVCKTLKQNDIKVVLDGVFNHVGRGFWAFKDVLQNRQNSRYINWFMINFDGNSNYNDGFWYEGWEGHYELVKLNLKNPEVVQHLLDCIKGWIQEFDIDGLRLDVAYSLDADFMRTLRRYCTDLKADFALIGEVLFGDYNVIVNDEMLHSCTNYECYKGLFSSMNDKNMFEISHSLNRQFGAEGWCIYRGKKLMSFVDNHDVSRIFSILNDKNTLPCVYALLFGMPGIPCIYYGSEWAQPGEKSKGDDWGLRPCFDEPIKTDLTNEIARLINAHKSTNALHSGDYKNIVINSTSLLFKREYNGEQVYVGVNIAGEQIELANADINGKMMNLITGEEVYIDGKLLLPPYGYVYLKR